MLSLSLSLLGGFHLEFNGTSVEDFESNKVRALLAYLAVEADRAHQRAVLATLLWPNHPEETARTNLRHVLRQLRRTLDSAVHPSAGSASAQPSPLLVTTRSTVHLNGDAVSLDVADFTARLARRAACDHYHQRSGTRYSPEDCPACFKDLRQAADLYRGEFLAGFHLYDGELFDEWAVVQRERHHQLALEVFYSLAAYHEQRGEYKEAHRFARRQVELEPWREEAHRQLMRILARSGLRSAALAQYERCRAILAEELGAEPSAETTRLYEHLRSGTIDPSHSPDEFDSKVVAHDAEAVTVHPADNHADNSTDSPADNKRAEERHSSAADWGEAPSVTYFYGRQAEVAQIQQWILDERSRLVAVLGMGGMGKTALVTRVARSITDQFDFVLWRSLINALPPEAWLRDAIGFFSRRQLTTLPDSFDSLLTLFFDQLRERRCLLILDNVETVLQPDQAGHFCPGHEGYARLLVEFGRRDHQSCILLTSRERPQGIGQLEDGEQVHTLPLVGLDEKAGEAILKTRGLSDRTNLVATLVRHYSGNPLALKLVARTIQELFDHDIAAFLHGDNGRGDLPIFDDIRAVLDQQFARLTPLECDILLWLAIEREAVSMPKLAANLVHPPSQRALLEALRALQRRSLLERTNDGFTLQNVVTEYLTDYLIETVYAEIQSGRIDLLGSHALLKAQSKEHVRQTQARLILEPLAARLDASLGREKLLARIHALLDRLRTQPAVPIYAGGNLLNLLIRTEVDLRGFNFSRLPIRQADLRGATLSDVDFTGADFTDSIFNDTFGVVHSVAFSPDDQLLAASTSDGEIRLWRRSDGQLLYAIKGHSDTAARVVFSPDGKLFASSGDDFSVRLWETESGRALRSLDGHTAWVRSIAFSSDGKLIVGSGRDHTIRVWDVASGKPLHVLFARSGFIRPIAFHPRGPIIAGSGADRTVGLWNAESGERLRLLRAETALIVSFAFSPDGALLAGGSDSGPIHIWDVGTGERIVSLAGHEREVRYLAFSPDGNTLASGSADYTVRLWDVRDLPPEPAAIPHQTLHGHVKGVNSVAFSPQGDTLISGSDDHTIRFWDARTGQARDTWHGHTARVRTLAFSPDGATLASGSDDTRVRIWDVRSGQLQHTLRGHHHWIWSMAFSPQGDLLASGGADHLLCLWDTRSGRARNIIQRHENTIRSLAFSPDGSLLATGCADNLVRLWEPTTGRLVQTLAGHTGWVQFVLFSPDGRTLASASNDRTVRLWDVQACCTFYELEDRRLRATLHGHKPNVAALAFSPNGKWLAGVGHENTVCLWDVETNQVGYSLTGHTQEVNSVAFSPDGRWLASGSSDHTVRLWRVGDSTVAPLPTHTLTGHTAWIRRVAFSPDGRTLASAGADYTIRLWDVASGRIRHVLTGHSHWIWTLTFSPLIEDFRDDFLDDSAAPPRSILASGSVDETIRLWDIESGTCIFTLQPRGPYAGMNITGVVGLSEAQKTMLKSLGAVEVADVTV